MRLLRWLCRPLVLLGISAVALVVIAVLPWTGAGFREAFSMATGGWNKEWSPMDYPIPQKSDIAVPPGQGVDAELVTALSRPYDGSGLKPLEGLWRKYPNNPEICAAFLTPLARNASLHDLRMSTLQTATDKQRAEQMQSVLEGDPKRLLAIQVAGNGAKAAPNNAYFPLMQSVAYEGLRMHIKAAELAAQAARLPRYDSYVASHYRKLADAEQAAGGKDVYRYFQTVRTKDYAGPEQPEFNCLALMWSRDETDVGIRRRADLINCAVTIIRDAQNIGQIRAGLFIVDLAIGRRERDRRLPYRSTNLGDHCREATRFQDRTTALGSKLKVDLPALLGSLYDLSGYGFDEDDWWDQIRSQEMGYPERVQMATWALRAGPTLACFALLFWLATLMPKTFLPRHAIPGLIAAALASVTLFDLNSAMMSLMPVLFACYLIIGILSIFPKLFQFCAVLGTGLSAYCIMVGFDKLWSGGWELLPSVAFIVCLARYFWLSKTGPSRVFLIPFLIIGLAAVICALGPDDLGEFALCVPVSALVCLVVVVGWQSSPFANAAKQLLKALPWSAVAGVAVVAFFSVVLTIDQNTMMRLVSEEAPTVQKILRRLDNMPLVPPRSGARPQLRLAPNEKSLDGIGATGPGP